MALSAAPRMAVLNGTAVAVVVGYCVAMAWALTSTPFDIWGAFLIGPALILISLPILLREGRLDPDRRMGTLLIIGLVLKLFAALPRYWMSFELYDGAADAARYALEGSIVAEQVRNGDLAPNTGLPLVGTGFVVLVTGYVFALTGPTTLGGFIFFSWLGFWGLFFFNRAFREGVPGGDRWRFAVLLFLLPSMLFWPSSLGKDALMLFGLGIFAYGASLVLNYRAIGWLYLLAGSALTVLVRPHITLMAVFGLCLAYVLRKHPKERSTFRTLAFAAVLIAGSSLVLQRAAGFFGLESLEAEDISSVIERTGERTTGGGSTFEAAPASSPLNLPSSIVTVLFRPFPFEAHNVQTLITSLEGTVLLILTIMSISRLRRLPRYLRSTPYLVFVIVYALMFCYAFSSFSNFGILARERIMVFPMIIALLALSARADLGRAPDIVSRTPGRTDALAGKGHPL